MTADDNRWRGELFERHRTHLRSVAYRMLGSLTEAEDAVQETWLRLDRSDTAEVDNLGGWLTTVIGRVCLDMLRQRRTRREEPLGVHVPDPIVHTADSPEAEAVLADSVGLALLVVLDTLAPAERLAFVLHDMFGMPFDEIGAIVGRSTGAATQLASRARRRVRGAATPDHDTARQRTVIEAFIAASKEGNFDKLVALLHPDVVLRADFGNRASTEVRGAEQVAGRALTFARNAPFAVPALVNGSLGFVAVPKDRPTTILSYTVRDGVIMEIDILADQDRIDALDLPDFHR